MTDTRQAILNAIRANPDDDTARLVFADWLEEHGDETRAEFIRLQCHHPSPEAPGRERSQRRAEALLEAHHQEWLAEVPSQMRDRVSFRRGFPTHFRAETPERLAEARRLNPKPWIESVALEIRVGGLSRLLKAGNCEGLSDIDFHGFMVHFSDADAIALSRHQGLTSLRSLRIPLHLTRAGAEAFALAPCLAGLRHLALHGSKSVLAALAQSDSATRPKTVTTQDSNIDADEVRDFLASPCAERLTGFSLAMNRVGGVTSAVSRSARLAQLEWLGLMFCEAGDGEVSELANSHHVGDLRALELSANRLTPFGVASLSDSPKFDRLEALSLWMNEFGDEGVAELAKARFAPGLRELKLTSCRLTADGFRILATSPLMEGLTSLEAGWNEMGAEGAEALAQSPAIASLVNLDLLDCPIGDAGALALAASPYLDGLEKLTLGHCGVTDHGRAALRERFGDAVSL